MKQLYDIVLIMTYLYIVCQSNNVELCLFSICKWKYGDISQVFVFVSVRAGYQLNLAQPDCNWWPAVMESNVYLHSFQTE